jgi:uncharacterized RDD family membrane protein YckC
VQPEERLIIDTPEQISLELPVAGIGSRFLAVAVDTVLQALLLVTGALAAALALSRPLRLVQLAGPPMAILFTFCVYWGYFAFFETIWSGQTPGKRLAGIRVIHESGRPISWYEAVGRNVLRAVDFLPALYGVGVITMMLNRHSRRVGDYVAGTVVVYDTLAGRKRPDRFHSMSSATSGATSSAPTARITAPELELIETYLRRRRDLDWMVREAMADQIIRRITQTTGVARDAGQSADEFLETMARRARDGARFG